METLVYLSGTGYITASLLFIGFVPVERIVSFRVLPGAIIASIIILGQFSNSERHLSRQIGYLGVFVGLVGIACGVSLYSVGLDIGATLAVIGLTGLIAAISSSINISPRKLLVLMILFMILITPVLYPWPAVNAVPNQPGTIEQERMTMWLDKHGTEYKIAANTGLQRIDYYQDASEYDSRYDGSTWLFKQYVLESGETPIRTDYTATGEPVAPTACLYVSISSFDSGYIPVAYAENGVGYKEIRTLTPTEFESQTTTSSRIFDLGDRNVVYLHCKQ
jgi:hypothetical protein